jgi:hypothetical protein
MSPYDAHGKPIALSPARRQGAATLIAPSSPPPGLYAYPEVGTFGLAHSLLAWARCRLWSNRTGVPMLAPNWLHVRGRLGPLRRRERDSRMYHLLFHFPGHVTGLRWWWLLSTQRRVAAEEVDLSKVLAQRERAVVVFRNRLQLNEETHFREVIDHGPELRRELIAITRPQFLPQRPGAPHVALHVRMGDFSPSPSRDALRQGAKNSRIPLDWYVEMLSGLRRAVGPVPALLYSDGTDADLAKLLALPDVMRPPKAPSVTDLLGISQARLLISSGSGFSTWGSFLGDVPRICFPGQRFTRVLVRSDDAQPDLEPECESWNEMPAATVQAIQVRLGRA